MLRPSSCSTSRPDGSSPWRKTRSAHGGPCARMSWKKTRASPSPCARRSGRLPCRAHRPPGPGRAGRAPLRVEGRPLPQLLARVRPMRRLPAQCLRQQRESDLYVAEADMPLFCAAALPTIEQHLHVDTPAQIAARTSRCLPAGILLRPRRRTRDLRSLGGLRRGRHLLFGRRGTGRGGRPDAASGNRKRRRGKAEHRRSSPARCATSAWRRVRASWRKVPRCGGRHLPSPTTRSRGKGRFAFRRPGGVPRAGPGVHHAPR